MTSYGTIPTSTLPQEHALFSSQTEQFVTQAKERIKSGLGSRRAWHQVLISPTLPDSFNDALNRITTNFSYFYINYAIITLLVLFLSLLWHPGTLVVLVFMISVWLFLYILRERPMVVYGQEIDDLVVLIGLCGVTILMLILTHATFNLAVGVGSGLLLVLIHSVLRGTDDLYIVKNEVVAAGSATALPAAGNATALPAAGSSTALRQTV